MPPGLSIDPATGKITGTIDPTAEGDYPVTVVVSDGQSSTSIEFTLTVTRPDAGPGYLYFPHLRR